MATLHLPKKRPNSSKEEPRKNVHRALDENLEEETFPGSDPATANDPGSAEEALISNPGKSRQ